MATHQTFHVDPSPRVTLTIITQPAYARIHEARARESPATGAVRAHRLATDTPLLSSYEPEMELLLATQLDVQQINIR